MPLGNALYLAPQRALLDTGIAGDADGDGELGAQDDEATAGVEA